MVTAQREEDRSAEIISGRSKRRRKMEVMNISHARLESR